jgi:hypothetical protein
MNQSVTKKEESKVGGIFASLAIFSPIYNPLIP